jgi:hypothetical protein
MPFARHGAKELNRWGFTPLGIEVFVQARKIRPTALAVIRKATEIREKLENQVMQGDSEKHLLKAETKS